jgi:rubrerythrin
MTKKVTKEFKPKKAKAAETDHWYCAHCTFANENSKKRCDMCNNVKKVLKDPKF